MLDCWHSFYLFCWLRLFRQKLVKYSRQNMVAISRRQHFFPSSISAVTSSRVFSLGFVMAGRSFLPVGVEKGQSISRLPFWVGIKFYCVLFYLTLIVLTLYLNGIFHHHYSIIVLIADCTALYLPSFECAAKQVIKYAFPSFSYRTTML